jgi:hypothetical protein
MQDSEHLRSRKLSRPLDLLSQTLTSFNKTRDKQTKHDYSGRFQPTYQPKTTTEGTPPLDRMVAV